MARLIKPLFSDEATGKLSGVLSYRRNPSCAAAAGLPRRPRLASQPMLDARAMYSSICSTWRAMSSAQRAPYAAIAVPPQNAWNMFVKLNMRAPGSVSWLPGFSYRVRVVVDHSKVNADLAHFPLLVKLSSSCGLLAQDLSAVFTELGSNRLKIAVTKADGVTQLYVESAASEWMSASSLAYFWISKSDWVISSSAATVFYLYFDHTAADNSAYVAAPGSRPEVWDAACLARYGCAQDPSGAAPQVLDSTSGARHMTTRGSMNTADLQAGLYGKCLHFDGSNDGASFTAVPVSAYPFSIQHVCKLVNITGSICLAGFYNSSAANERVQSWVNAGEAYSAVCHSSAVTWAEPNPRTLNDWVLICSEFRALNDFEIFVNGVSVKSSVTSIGFPTSPSKLAIGFVYNSSPSYYPGLIQDVHFISGVRSAAWKSAYWHNVCDSLLYFGAIEEAP